ncbi:hypothetical protein JL722_5719 [Aureococcus anophagefferens]|nr:hypothetical protein JL722_5719 [Aureococcus anophagefferens]
MFFYKSDRLEHGHKLRLDDYGQTATWVIYTKDALCVESTLFAGFGCVRQTITGSGTAFVEASGTVERKELAPGELFIIDSNSLVAWHGATLGVRTAGSCLACCCNAATRRSWGRARPGSSPCPGQYRRQMGVVIEKDKKGGTVRRGPAAPEMHRE